MKQLTTRVEDETHARVKRFAMRQRAADTSRAYSISDALRDLIKRGLGVSSMADEATISRPEGGASDGA